MPAKTTLDATLLAFAVENAELRAALREAQEQAVEAAVDAGELHAEVETLRRQLAEARVDRDAWRTRAARHAS